MKLRTAGGFGHYQRLATFIIVVGYALMGSVYQGLLFFLQFPSQYQCLVQGSDDSYENCQRSDICENGRQFKIDYN